MSTVVIQAAGGEEVKMEEEYAKMVPLVQELMDEQDAGEALPITKVSKGAFEKITDFLKIVKEEGAPDIERPLITADMTQVTSERYANMIALDKEQVFELANAAQYLKLESLHHLACAKVASFLMGKNPDEVRAVLGVPDDLSADMKAQIKEENEFAAKLI